MTTLHTTLLLALLISTAPAQTFVWNRPPAPTPVSGYILYHGTSSGQYSQAWSTGPNTNYTCTMPLPPGVNYFAVADFLFANGVLQMSAWSNEVALTNTPELLLSETLLTTTNLGGEWLPFQTNSFLLNPADAQRFFRDGPLRLTKTNVITFPMPL
jgi:hypothetical protein